MVTSLLIGLLAGLFMTTLLLAAKSFVLIEDGHLGVRTRFGRAMRSSDGSLLPLEPGLHFKAPWEHVSQVSMMERLLDLSGETGGIVAMAADSSQLRLDAKLRYTLTLAELEQFLFKLARPLEHVRGLFVCLLRNEIANFQAEAGDLGSSYAALRRERRRLNARVSKSCHSRMDHRYGVAFNGIDMVDILPPDELAAALNAVSHARAEADTRVARAEGECRQRLLAAEREVEITTARAKAAAIDVEVVGGVLAGLQKSGTLGDYVTRRRSEVTARSQSLVVRRST